MKIIWSIFNESLSSQTLLLKFILVNMMDASLGRRGPTRSSRKNQCATTDVTSRLKKMPNNVHVIFLISNAILGLKELKEMFFPLSIKNGRINDSSNVVNTRRLSKGIHLIHSIFDAVYLIRWLIYSR